MIPTNIFRSITLSSIAGVVKVFSQIAVAIVVFPIIVRTGGVQALGAWVMLQLIIGYFGLTNFGMGAALTRTIARSDRGDGARFAAVAGTVLSSILIALLLFALLFVFIDQLIVVVSSEVSTPVTSSVIWMTYAAVILRLASSIVSAAVAGVQRTDLVQVSNTVQVLAYILCTVILVSNMSLLVALSTSFMVSYAIEFLFNVFVAIKLDIHSKVRRQDCGWSDITSFLRQCVSFLAVDFSLITREPLLKLAIFWAGGAEPVGYYEIASKVPATIRQGFVQGLSSLMPAFAHLFDAGDIRSAIAIGRVTLLYIVLGAVAALSVYFFNAEFVFRVWLGESNELLISFTYVSTLWWTVSSFNVPAWWLGIGVGDVWRSAVVVATHLMVALLVLLASFNGLIGPLAALIYWTIGGIAMQVLLYVNVGRMTTALKPMYIQKRVLIAVLVVFTSTAVMFFGSKLFSEAAIGENMRAILTITIFIVTHIVLVVAANRYLGLGLLRLKQSLS